MALDLWFRADVARILQAAHEAHTATAAAFCGAPTAEVEDYSRGFRDALRAVAAGFGVEPPGTVRAGYEVQAERFVHPE